MPIPTRGEASPQPHDALFQWTFSQRRHAAGLLKAALPSPVAGAMDFRTLRVKRTSFVSPALRRRHSDLVVSVRLRGRRDHVYALIEHQRRVQRLMMLRKNSYMAQLWERLVRDNPALRGIPPIFPLLVHHSKAGWTAATTFQEIVSDLPPQIIQVMTRGTLDYFSRTFVRTVKLLTLDLRGKLALGLLDVAEGFGVVDADGRLLKVRLTHEDLAELTGVSRARVTKTLREFEEAGYVVRRGRDLVVNGKLLRELCG